MRKNLVFILMLLYAFSSLSQGVMRFRSLTKKDGLSDNTIFTIAQDGQGFIWFGTRNGLNRFDGYRFLKYQHNRDTNKSLVSNVVRSLLYDSISNSLWIGTNSGLSVLSLNNHKIENYLRFQNLSIRSIKRTKRQGLLLGTNHGLYRLTGDTTFVAVPDSLVAKKSINYIYEDREENIWIGTKGNLLKLSTQNNPDFNEASKPHPELSKLENLELTAILQDSRGDFWFGTNENGLYHWKLDQSELISYQHSEFISSSITSNRIRTITEDYQGKIIIGTSVGINIFDRDTENFTGIVNDSSNPEGLNNNSIRSVFEDKTGGLWIGTYFRGVNYTDKSFKRFNISYPYSSRLSDDRNIISAITSDLDKKIWVGTEGKGITNWNSSNLEFEFLNAGERFKDLNVKTIHVDESTIWVGTFRDGLFQFKKDGRLERHYHENGERNSQLPSNNIYDILKTGNQLFITSFDRGFIRLDITTGNYENFLHDSQDSESIISDVSRTIYEDHDGDIWLGTAHGISKIEKEINGDVKFRNDLAGNHIYCISSTQKGEIWIGTFNNGLYHFNKETKTFENYSIEEGLPGNTVCAILPKNEDLWLSTNNGIVKLITSTKEFITYGNNVELRGLDYIPNSGHIVDQDLYLFGSNSGLVFFQPKEIQSKTYIPPVVLSGLRLLDDKESLNQSIKEGILEDKKIVLDYNNANFQIFFSSLDYSNPENNRYAYRMRGVDSDWVYKMGNPEAIYTLQKEGHYIFEFKGSNSDGIWNPLVSSIEIYVSPPWFRSVWAYLLYILLFIGVIFIVYRLIKLRSIYHIEHIAKVEQERSHQLKTRFFTNITHELRTPLTLMIGPLHDIIWKGDMSGPIKNKLEGVYRNVERLSNLVNQLLDFRKMETDNMKMRVMDGDIIDLLKEIYFAFKEETTKRSIDFIFESDYESFICWYDADKIEKVFFNLLSNAIKFTPDYGLIKINVIVENEKVGISVLDNGPGIDITDTEQIFERFYERNSMNYSNYGVGIGLALSKQMIELHHGEIYVENNESGGSRFHVELRRGNSHFNKDEIVAEQKLKPQKEPTNEIEDRNIEEDGRKPKILLVEDDLEIREYIRSLFTESFEVFVASNGQEGIKVASNKLPDIIISDVMMPVMDGITFCRKIKTTIETSHIPVILLTARSSTPYKIGGLETGADDYLTKPFSSDELILKTKNILSTRKAYLEKLSRTHDFEPKKISMTSTDEKFIINLMDITEQNIENTGLNVDQLADELCVSRALLFTKIKSITGQTPKKFIQDIRLKRAVQLLKDTDLNVSQVAHKSGFQDYRYFSKIFKLKFGKSPKDFSKDTI